MGLIGSVYGIFGMGTWGDTANMLREQGMPMTDWFIMLIAVLVGFRASIRFVSDVQSDHSIDSNIAHHYYANIKKKFKIPALWVPLKFLGQVPIGKIFNFLDVKNHKIAVARSLCILAIRVRKETPLKI